MVKIISDKYVLGQSKSKTINNIRKEIKLDIDLKMNYNEITGAIVQGTVKDENKSPIEGALIQIISDKYEFIMHTTTNEDGTYNLDNIPLKKDYKLYAMYPNKKIPKGVQFTPKPFEIVKIDFDLEVDSTLKLSMITGITSNLETKEPIEDAVLYLYKIKDLDKIKDESNEILISVVKSNKDGYFSFSEISIGTYLVKATKLGFKLKEVSVNITKQPEIANLDFEIESREDEPGELGEISGIVKNEMGSVISNIDVVLYKVKEDGSEIPIAYTKTNEEGFYIFNNVINGIYKVKSNEIKIVSIGTDSNDNIVKSPNFTGFIISSPSTYIKTQHNISKDKLELLNNAVKYQSDAYNFISALGGTNNGMVNLFVTVLTEGFYIMSIKYTAEDKMRGVKLKVNNEIRETMFLVEKTNNVYEKDAKVFDLIINLQKGENIITIFNDTGEKAPNIINTTYELCGLKETINATKGRLFGVITGLEETFVIGIGSPIVTSGNSSKKAYFELDFYVTVANQYTFIIEYISGDDDRPLKIDVNGISFDKVYRLSKTDGWFANNAKNFYITFNLKLGKNTIKFYSEEGYEGPFIGNVTLLSDFYYKTIDIKKAIFTGEAKLVLNDTMVGALGGPLNSSMTLLFSGIEGEYNIFFSCLNDGFSSTNLKIDINGKNIASFTVLSTNGKKIEYAVQTNLELEENSIKFYNDNKDYSPYVGNVEIVLIGSGKIKTNAALGELNYEAKLSYGGAMVNLGVEEGSVYLPLKIPMYGSYKSTVDFIVGDEEGAAISLYINDRLYNVVSLPTTYINSVNDANQFIVKSNFTSKNDSITFFNHANGNNVNIGKILIEKEFQFIRNYALENIELLKGATFVNGAITNVFKNAGIIRLNIDVPKNGKYDLIISYLAETENTKSEIITNFIVPSMNIDFEKTNSMYLKDSKIKVVTLDLVQGLNIVQIYNP